MYKIFIERRAEKDLNALDNSLRLRIIERLLLLKSNSWLANVKKLVGSKNFYRLRVGDWRILYEIDDKNKEIKIYRIKHRNKAYQI